MSQISVLNQLLDEKYLNSCFLDIKQDGIVKNVLGLGKKAVLNTVESHIQGIAVYQKRYLICTHNAKGQSRGVLIINDLNKPSVLPQKYSISENDYNHPGGCQIIGDLLLVALETSNYKKSKMVLFDLRPLKKGFSPTKLPYYPKVFKRMGMGAISITNFILNGATHYAIGLVHGKILRFYTTADSIISPTCKLEFKFRKKLDHAFQGIGLYASESTQNSKLRLVGFYSTGKDISLKDHMSLHSIDVEKRRIRHIKTKHMKCKHGTSLGFLGVHFRWAGGLIVSSDKKIQVLSVQRNLLPDKFSINLFQS